LIGTRCSIDFHSVVPSSRSHSVGAVADLDRRLGQIDAAIKKTPTAARQTSHGASRSWLVFTKPGSARPIRDDRASA
jgi:hypothetical protein